MMEQEMKDFQCAPQLARQPGISILQRLAFDCTGIAGHRSNHCRPIANGLLAKLGIDSYDCPPIPAISARKSFRSSNREGI
jgi:hypothetical protein